MAGPSIAVITFNQNEAAAVDLLLDEIAAPGSDWHRDGPHGLELSESPFARLSHVRAGAQGNVVAASVLARLFADLPERPDFVVFYGCAGSTGPGEIGEVFLASSASYCSLGTVAADAGGVERVTIKSKWLVATQPHEVDPLNVVWFLVGGPTGDLSALTSIGKAHILATDKVVKIDTTSTVPPAHSFPGPPSPVYAKSEWTYAQTISLVRGLHSPSPVLVEMEAFGIGRIAEAFDLSDRVVVLRVVTDSLADHHLSDQAQQDLLAEGRTALLRVLHALLFPDLEI